MSPQNQPPLPRGSCPCPVAEYVGADPVPGPQTVEHGQRDPELLVGRRPERKVAVQAVDDAAGAEIERERTSSGARDTGDRQSLVELLAKRLCARRRRPGHGNSECRGNNEQASPGDSFWAQPPCRIGRPALGELGNTLYRLTPVGEDISILFDRIRVLLNDRETGRHAESDTVELTLTDGYARALALDGARLRTEGRIRELAGSDEHVGEVRILKERLTLLEEELAQLRGLLGTLAGVR